MARPISFGLICACIWNWHGQGHYGLPCFLQKFHPFTSLFKQELLTYLCGVYMNKFFFPVILKAALLNLLVYKEKKFAEYFHTFYWMPGCLGFVEIVCQSRSRTQPGIIQKWAWTRLDMNEASCMDLDGPARLPAWCTPGQNPDCSKFVYAFWYITFDHQRFTGKKC